MKTIYSFFNSVWIEILQENNKNKSFLALVLLLVTLPISMAVNNVFLSLFFLSAVVFFNFQNFKFNTVLIIPMILFFWMVVSLFWTINTSKTLQAIPKELALLLIPIAFMIMPAFSLSTKNKIIKYYSYSIVVYVIYFLIRAIIRYIITQNEDVFFYHGPKNDVDTGLVPRLLNAIHVSVYAAVAFFYFFIKEVKSKLDYALSFLLFVFVILLSSKNVIVIFVLLILIQVFFYSKIANRLRLRNISIILIVLGFIMSFSKIKERFLIEFKSNVDKNISHSVALNKPIGVNNISIAEAWQNSTFTPNDYFPGTAFRVYQCRLFIEFLNEESIFWKGFGLNASQDKLLEKEKKYNLYPGYGSFNFHNQYIQNFAELGIVGFLLLILLLIINLKNALKSKDFIHIAFAVLMISLFLTESFLWRQRGVVFFTLLYCLFNTNKNTINE